MSKLPSWIWPVGLVLIVLMGISFVQQCVEATPTHGQAEKAVLVIGVTIATALVTWYWSAKWMQLRRDVTPGTSLLSRISLRHRILIGLALLALTALVIQGFRMSFNPALKQSEDFVRSNAAVLAAFGPINDLTIDAMRWNVETAPDGTSNGKYTFDLTGAKQAGIVEVHWQTAHGVYAPTEIDQLPTGDNGHLQTLWQSK